MHAPPPSPIITRTHARTHTHTHTHTHRSSLAYAAHDSSLHVVTFSDGASPVHQVLVMHNLPLTSVAFCSDIGIIGGGHDCTPLAFALTAPGTADGWQLMGGLEESGMRKSLAWT